MVGPAWIESPDTPMDSAAAPYNKSYDPLHHSFHSASQDIYLTCRLQDDRNMQTQLLNTESYLIPPPANERQCIANAAKGRRCGCNISKEELAEALTLASEAGLLTAEERERALEQIVCLRVCNNRHRQKLRADKNCLQSLVQRYDGLLSGPSKVGTPLIIEHHLRTQSSRGFLREAHVQDNSNMLNAAGIAGQLVRSSGPNPSVQQIFQPYQRISRDNLRNVLKSSIPANQYRDGFVYVFKWPSNPEFVKIGYVKASAKTRVAQWSKCHSGAELFSYAPFAFPERMERLIHLEMADKRHQITLCESCCSTHIEWFKASAEEATRIVKDWQEVTIEERLYTTHGTLSSYWNTRVTNIPIVTATSLLEALKTDSENKQSLPTRISADTKAGLSLGKDCDSILQVCDDFERKLVLVHGVQGLI